jgi:enoyl-CoA hydratase
LTRARECTIIIANSGDSTYEVDAMTKHTADWLWEARSIVSGFLGNGVVGSVGLPSLNSGWGLSMLDRFARPERPRMLRSAVVGRPSAGQSTTQTVPPLLRTGVVITSLTGGLLIGSRGVPLVLRRGSGAVSRVPRRAQQLVSAITGSIPIGASRSGNEVPPGSELQGPAERVPVSLHVGGGVAVITLRRPQKMNAINSAMWSAIARMVHQVSKDERVRVLVLRGEGQHFSAGSDLKELGRSDLLHVEEIFHRAEECAAALEESPLPTIASIRGYAMGTGLLLALACDMRITEQDATLGMPIARLGITLSEAFVRRLVALTGPGKMKDLVYTGRFVDAEEAVRLGLVERVVPQDKSLLHETLLVARTIRQHSKASIRAAKRWGGSGSGRAPAAYGYVDPKEFPEGVEAFLERRTPRFYNP